MSVVESSSVIESKATLGLPWAVASPIQEVKEHMVQWECAYGVLEHRRYTQRELRTTREMGKREPALVLSLESFQYKEGTGKGQEEGRQRAK